ncbi:hypothetical protein [Streptomyces sp. NPDC088725]|uniref:hypothetical protein n=1 Tax=Streptomyces sp. NPDC088725 TaxID=3365873 RepID=UPI0037FEAB9B
MSLVKLIAQSDERGLAASGLGCLDRCLPLRAERAGVLKPLWVGIVRGPDGWPARLATARSALETPDGSEAPGSAVAAALVRTMLESAPSDWAAGPLRTWADTCSLVALEIHQEFDTQGAGGAGRAVPDDSAELLARCREQEIETAGAADGIPGADGPGPLVTGELRRQTRILEILAETPGSPGLRRVMDLSAEGQRVLRAVVSRRARAGT